ncbi:MAG: Type 1 glutamine amidotransferase-like domain-containing protein [Rhodobacter sp.]|nr:Type 1 glutamine amidotransferase-like domain-containing protein [Rhodobacter sp.]MCY4240734.1 Type 1 glutamine amidotransferase-like domain-containing protein [Rhodobacter sp.]
MPSTTLIAIGGGGATHGTHPELDRLCIEYTASRRRIGYIGTASGDDLDKHRRFCDGFRPFSGTLSQLSKQAERDQARIWAEGLDLIYIGGGSPTLLVDHWKSTGIGTVLIEAFRRGVTLAGVSAGAMCCFESFLWRSSDDGLQVSEGLGIVQGSMTPHSQIEPDRRAHMHGLVTSGAIPEGFAVDDGAALVLREGDPVRSYPYEGPPFVHRIRRREGEIALNP